MKFTSWVHYFWKVPVCGLLFFIGFIPGNWLATWMGLSTPDMPAGADQATVLQYILLGSLISAVELAVLARGLSTGFLMRWLMLFFFSWIAFGVNNYLEASIFTTMGAASLYSVVLYFPALLFCSAAVAWLFPPEAQNANFFVQARSFFTGRTIGNWTWRLLAGYIAFPLAYLLFGTLIAPIVIPYYRQDPSLLALPGWNQILPVLAIRSLLFLFACLPILIAWRLSNLRLFIALGLTLFIFVGGLGMFSAYWLAPTLRLTHSLEIFADELVYAGSLTLLFNKHKQEGIVYRSPVTKA